MWRHAYWFWKKIPPSTHISTLHVYWFLRFFPPSTPRLLHLCTSFFQKIPTTTFIPTSRFSDFATFATPPRLFQPPRLLERWEYVSESVHLSHVRFESFVNIWKHYIFIYIMWLNFFDQAQISLPSVPMTYNGIWRLQFGYQLNKQC